MSWLDGVGEIDGWCHRCGAELPKYDGGRVWRVEEDFCEGCLRRDDVRQHCERDRQLSREAHEASKDKP